MHITGLGMERIVDEIFDGNRKNCSISVKISLSTISRLSGEKVNAGHKVMGRFIIYCEKNQIDYKEYISMDSND